MDTDDGTTRIWTFSDLHQEWGEPNAFDPMADAPDAFDVVVVAGDIDTPLTRSLEWLGSRLPGCRVVYVPGNHDFYLRDEVDKYTLWDQLERGRELADRLGIDLLLDGRVEIGGTRFLGGTLWTNLRLWTSSRGMAHSTARRGMNDYKRIRRKGSGRHRHLRPDETVEMHTATVSFLEGAMAQPFEGPTVVVTHHAPHPGCIENRYDGYAHCYASNLEHVMSQGRPELWIHGHVHRQYDAMVGGTRVMANPRGHWNEESRTTFDPARVVTVSPGRAIVLKEVDAPDERGDGPRP